MAGDELYDEELSSARFLRLASQSSDPRYDFTNQDVSDCSHLENAVKTFIDPDFQNEKETNDTDMISHALKQYESSSSYANDKIDIENQRQNLIVFLLQKVCSVLDHTPKTFILNCLKMFEYGILTDLSFLRAKFFHNADLTSILPDLSVSNNNISEYKTNQVYVPPIKTPSFHLDSFSGQPNKDLNISRYKSDFVEICLLGKGSFGKVFKAQHKLDGKCYAVKQIKFSNIGFNSLLQRKVLREVICIAKLDHPNVCRYYNA